MTFKILKSYLQFFRYFRNGHAMIRALRGGPPCDVAILWDGTRIEHPPGVDGMVTVLLDLWVDRCFLKDNFYSPAAGDVLVDCGAHIGLFTTLMARSNPRCRVEALEPFPESFRYLVSNIRAACPANATAHNLAVGRRSGFGWIDPRGSGRSIDHVFVVEDGPRLPESVPILTLPELFGLAKVDEISFLKVDIEGSENDLFAEATPDVLQRISKIGLEYHDNLRPGTLDLLKDRLVKTHNLRIEPSDSGVACGILLASRK